MSRVFSAMTGTGSTRPAVVAEEPREDEQFVVDLEDAPFVEIGAPTGPVFSAAPKLAPPEAKVKGESRAFPRGAGSRHHHRAVEPRHHARPRRAAGAGSRRERDPRRGRAETGTPFRAGIGRSAGAPPPAAVGASADRGSEPSGSFRGCRDRRA